MLSVYDAHINSSKANAEAILLALRPARHGGQNLPFVKAGGVVAFRTMANPLNPNGTNPEWAEDHVDQHWFGKDGATAWWRGWSTETNADGTNGIEELMRWTFIAALEVSLGVPHLRPTDTVTNPVHIGTRHWPVHSYWGCGAPFFQGYVSWHQHDGIQGRVTGTTHGVVQSVLMTPATGEAMYATPIDPTQGGLLGFNVAAADKVDYEEHPSDTSHPHGLWVIGHSRTTAYKKSKTGKLGKEVPIDDGVLPNAYDLHLITGGDVVVVSPSELSGGIRRNGR
jgi:hypothetical protein